MTNKEITQAINWKVCHDLLSPNKFILSGDFNEDRFTQITYDGFWGIPLKYSRWRIEKRFIALYGNN